MTFQNTPIPRTFESVDNDTFIDGRLPSTLDTNPCGHKPFPPIVKDSIKELDKLAKPIVNQPLGPGNGIWQPQVPAPSQVGGTHYAKKKIQPVDAMLEWMSPEQVEGFYRGNVIKYIARYKDKNGLEDLEKCKDYLNRLIDFLKETK